MAITFTTNLDLRANRITNMAGPALSTDAATKQYVDNVAAGLNWKDAVRVAATGNLDVAAPGTVDGVALVDGDRVLLMGQTNAIENGIYVFDGAALGRAGDADGLDPAGLSELRPGTAVTVSEGTDNGNHTYVITTDGTVDIGVTPINWSLLNAGTAPVYTAGDGIDITNHVVTARQATDAGISIGAGGIAVLTDPDGGLQNTNQGVGVKVVADTGLATDVNGLRIVVPTTTALYTDADGLQLLAGNGITTDDDGVTAIADPDGGLQVLGAGIGAKLPAASGLFADAAGLVVKPDPDGALTLGVAGVAVKPNTAAGIAVDADGVAVVLRGDDGLEMDNTGLGVKTDPDGSLRTSAAGLAVLPEPDMGLMTGADGLAVRLNANGGLRVENLGIRVLADPAVVNDPAGPSLIVGGNGVAVNTALFPRKFAASITGTGTNIPVTHNLNSLDVQVEVYEVASGQTVYADVYRTDVNTVTLGFGTAPAAGQYRVVIVG